MPKLSRSVLLFPVAISLVAVLAACGSHLDPVSVAGAGGRQVDGTGSSGGSSSSTGSSTGGDTSTGTGSSDFGDSGSTSGSDTSTGTTGGTTTSTSGGSTSGSTGGSTGGGTSGGSTGGTGGGTSGGSSGSTTGGTGGGTSGGTSGGTGGSTGGATGGGPPADAGPCDGLKNGTGITDDKIVIGNSSDVSGPVPGLFEQSQDATRAFVEFFNATSDICGRKLELKTYDSKTDAGADQQAYASACNDVFAMVGSMSAFDSGGAATAQGCGLPDIRSAIVTTERGSCSTCFGAQSTKTGETQNVAADYILKHFGDAGQHSAFLYINAGASKESAPRQAAAMGKRGLHFDYLQAIDTAEFNYAPFVQKLKDMKIQTVFWTGAASMSVRLRQTMATQGYTPTVYMRDPTDYTPEYVESGGKDVDKTIVYLNFVPFEEASSSPEMSLYLGYLNQTKPGADPGFFGTFSWSAARLFTDTATKLGGKLTRASLVAAIGKVDNWTGRGITSPQHVGPRRTGDCFRFIQLDGTTWKPLDGTKYQCHGTTTG